MADDASKARKTALWLKKKVDVSFGKSGDKKFEKSFFQEENITKVLKLYQVAAYVDVHC